MGEVAERGIDRVRRSLLTRVIQARLEEIFDEVQTRLQEERVRCRGRTARGSDRRRLPACRRARTGGARAEQAGPHRTAADLSGLAAAATGPAYATALGLLIAGATRPPEMNDPNPPTEVKTERRGLARWLPPSLFG